jgi:hypothetical protein
MISPSVPLAWGRRRGTSGGSLYPSRNGSFLPSTEVPRAKPTIREPKVSSETGLFDLVRFMGDVVNAWKAAKPDGRTGVSPSLPFGLLAVSFSGSPTTPVIGDTRARIQAPPYISVAAITVASRIFEDKSGR